MGTVISLDAFRERRRSSTPVGRLDLAVDRLDPLVRSRGERLTPTIERELRAIAQAVSDGRTQQAADRAERLANLLEHPAAIG